MPLERLFKGKYLIGKSGFYPLTLENLIRVGLALCVYLKLHKGVEKPSISVEDLNFITLALGVGFMAGGGDLYVEDDDCRGNIKISFEKGVDEEKLMVEGLEDYELKIVESILFSRYNMPKAEGDEIGKIWIQGKKP